MANNRLAYGLAKQYGIDTTDMEPKEVWEALAEKGVVSGAYTPKGRLATIVRDMNKPYSPSVKSKKLTKQEYAIWKDCCAKISRGYKGYLKLADSYLIVVDKKILITLGDYPDNYITQILKFKSHYSQEATLKEVQKFNDSIHNKTD